MNVDQFEQRIKRLEDIEEIKKLKIRYALACDDMHDPDQVCSLFVEDGLWENDEFTARGHGEIRTLFEEFGAMWQFTQHNMLNPLIEVDGTHASGIWYILAVFRAASGESHWSALRYDDTYRKVDGQWQFEHVRVTRRTQLKAVERNL